MKIGIVTALPEEFSAVAESLGGVVTTEIETFRSGRSDCCGHDYFLVQAGMGFKNAAAATGMMVRIFQPDVIISAGFCGGLVPELRVGDVVVAKRIIISHEGGFEEVPVSISGLGQTFAARQAAVGKRITGGVFISTATITAKGSLAAALPEGYVNPVVEMESGAIAIVATEHAVPLVAIRAVSDGVAEELDFLLDEFCDAELRRIRVVKVLLTVLRRPHIIPQLVRLARSSRRAAQSLTAALPDLFSLLHNTPRY